MLQVLSGDLLEVALALEAVLHILHVDVLELAVLEMHILPGELGEHSLIFINLGESALREALAHVAHEVVAIYEDMRAIGALAELDLAPAQQVHQHERMVVERQAHHGPRPHAGDNLGLGILVGSTRNRIKIMSFAYVNP